MKLNWVRDIKKQIKFDGVSPPKDRSFILADGLLDCPPFWIKFVENTNIDKSREGELLVDKVLLKEYQGVIVDDFVVFKDKVSAVMFKLRWS